MNNKAKSDGRSQTLGMVQVALFAALIIIMAFTPFLGYIRLDLQGRRLSMYRLLSVLFYLVQRKALF